MPALLHCLLFFVSSIAVCSAAAAAAVVEIQPIGGKLNNEPMTSEQGGRGLRSALRLKLHGVSRDDGGSSFFLYVVSCNSGTATHVIGIVFFFADRRRGCNVFLFISLRTRAIYRYVSIGNITDHCGPAAQQWQHPEVTRT